MFHALLAVYLLAKVRCPKRFMVPVAALIFFTPEVQIILIFTILVVFKKKIFR